MTKTDLIDSCEEQFEEMIGQFLDNEFAVADAFLPQEIALGLRANLLAFHQAGLMYPAGTGRNFDFKKNTAVRGDSIRWLEACTKDIYEDYLLQKVVAFINHLNHTCYTGLKDYEFHYAIYTKNSFYKRHKDQFKHDKGRQFSLVIYLNSEWDDKDGGILSLYTGSGEARVKPLIGRAVFFKSDRTEHEVHPALKKSRLSIAGWLKSI
ncbi:MAG TPA: 2OG-Fe(II) oxygenase [Saprospiraceae bacterium]|nr:2OG-Fe(II) oxygenase [Saprospiraceae bacterium]